MPVRLVAFLVLASWLTGGPARAEVDFGAYHALVIGINEY